MEGKIYSIISSVMAEIGAIGKSSRNQTQGFMYRGIDAVMNTLNPVMAKHHLIILPEVLDIRREERQTSKGGNLTHTIATVRYTFYADDGSSVSAVVVGEGMDSGDKSTSKALSIAYKYAAFQIFCIPTEEMVDPDRESYDVKPRQKIYDKGFLKEHGNDKIGQDEAEQLKVACQRSGKSLESALMACKVSKVTDITYVQYMALLDQCA